MADPFEVRMRFTSHLQHLNASVTSAQKAAHYALRYRDMDEDLHSCILEQLEKNNMNNRANIMYFIEHLCDMAQRENHLEFVKLVQSDILRIIDAVAPSDGSGAANVKVVRRVLNGLHQKDVFPQETVNELEECLKERDTAQAQAHPALSPVAAEESANPTKPPTPQLQQPNGLSRAEKRKIQQIEQRIEEDRERHKRLRENIWAISAEGNKEFEKLWEDTSDIGEDDLLAAHEDAEEREQATIGVD